MGRLIDASNIRVKPQYIQDVMGIAMIRCEDLSRILAETPTVETIPKDQYEARLKADMVAMLEDLDLQIDESAAYNREVARVQRLLRDKINALKAEIEPQGNEDNK